MMGKTLNWIKGNPVTTGCVIIILLALASFWYPTYVQGVAFRQKLRQREAQLNEIENFRQTRAVIPPDDPDDPPTELRTVINDQAIQKLRNVYDQLEQQFNDIYQAAERHNRSGHEPMLKGLFPQPVSLSKPFDARTAYRQAFKDLYKQLDAGTPPTTEQIQKLKQREEQALRRSYFLSSDANLSADQKKELLNRQAKELGKLYRRRANQAHVYAPEVVLSRSGEWQKGPFQIGAWSRRGRKPTMWDLWEGQMQLWIQQDLVEAIARANNRDDPETSLVEQPVKQVLTMIVKPGYIGVPESGIFGTSIPDSSQISQRVQELQEMSGQELEDDFAISPTGRTSNPIYDVRHAVLRLVVDSQQIPKLLNSIGQVNFMTVIGMDMTDLDEYEALRAGYFYGQGVDAVELELTIESLWMRSWTAGHLTQKIANDRGEQFNGGLMPEVVRHHLGLPPRDREALRDQLQALQGSEDSSGSSSSS